MIITLLLIAGLIATPVEASSLVKKSSLTPMQLQIVEEHETQSGALDQKTKYQHYSVKHYVKSDSSFDEQCLKLVDEVSEQSFEGCMLTAKLPAEIVPVSKKFGKFNYEVDKEIQTKAHNEHTAEMKKHLCRDYMTAAKYHKQQTYCKIKHDSKWYSLARYLLNKKVYKYVGIYISKADIIWAKDDHDITDIYFHRIDERYATHPIHLAGNLRNYAYETDTRYQAFFTGNYNGVRLTQDGIDEITRQYNQKMIEK